MCCGSDGADLGSGNDLSRSWKLCPVLAVLACACTAPDDRAGEDPVVDGVRGDEEPSDDSGLEGSSSGMAGTDR